MTSTTTKRKVDASHPEEAVENTEARDLFCPLEEQLEKLFKQTIEEEVRVNGRIYCDPNYDDNNVLAKRRNVRWDLSETGCSARTLSQSTFLLCYGNKNRFHVHKAKATKTKPAMDAMELMKRNVPVVKMSLNDLPEGIRNFYMAFVVVTSTHIYLARLTRLFSKSVSNVKEVEAREDSEAIGKIKKINPNSLLAQTLKNASEENGQKAIVAPKKHKKAPQKREKKGVKRTHDQAQIDNSSLDEAPKEKVSKHDDHQADVIQQPQTQVQFEYGFSNPDIMESNPIGKDIDDLLNYDEIQPDYTYNYMLGSLPIQTPQDFQMIFSDLKDVDQYTWLKFDECNYNELPELLNM